MLKFFISFFTLSLGFNIFAGSRQNGAVVFEGSFRPLSSHINGADRKDFKRAIYEENILDFLSSERKFKKKGKLYKISPFHLVDSGIKIFARETERVQETIIQYLERKIEHYKLDLKKKSLYKNALNQLQSRWQAQVKVKVKGKLTGRIMTKSVIIDYRALVNLMTPSFQKKGFIEEVIFDATIHSCEYRLAKQVRARGTNKKNQMSELDQWTAS